MKSKEIVYHANFKSIENIELQEEKFSKDFSVGFYCTNDKRKAEVEATKYKNRIVNVYLIKNLDGLNIKKFEKYSEEWLEFIIACRKGYKHGYDVVDGPVGDDTIYDYIEAYEVGQMNKEYFFCQLRKKHYSKQISFNTNKALEKIEFLESYQIDEGL